MNAFAPPPNLDDRHAATIAQLLFLLDQLLCAIVERARLPWYARWLASAWVMRPVMAWGEAWIAKLRREIEAIGEQFRGGLFDSVEANVVKEQDAPAIDAARATQDPARPGNRASSAGRDRSAMPDGADAPGNPSEPELAAEELDRDDDSAGGETPVGAVARADPPDGGARSANVSQANGAEGGEAVSKGGRRQTRDGPSPSFRCRPMRRSPMRCWREPCREVFRGRRDGELFHVYFVSV